MYSISFMIHCTDLQSLCIFYGWNRNRYGLVVSCGTTPKGYLFIKIYYPFDYSLQIDFVYECM